MGLRSEPTNDRRTLREQYVDHVHGSWLIQTGPNGSGAAPFSQGTDFPKQTLDLTIFGSLTYLCS
jgi:hypothetical protein